jgi:membrane protein YdbS with pleckstrin-like domain
MGSISVVTAGVVTAAATAIAEVYSCKRSSVTIYEITAHAIQNIQKGNMVCSEEIVPNSFQFPFE